MILDGIRGGERAQQKFTFQGAYGMYDPKINHRAK